MEETFEVTEEEKKEIDEKLEKSKKLKIKSLNSDIKNKERELDDFKYNIEVLGKNLVLKTEELGLREKAGVIMVEHYRKLKPDFAFEEIPEYNGCMTGIQRIINQFTVLTITGEIRNFKKQIKASKEQQKSLTISLKMIKEEIATMEV